MKKLNLKFVQTLLTPRIFSAVKDINAKFQKEWTIIQSLRTSLLFSRRKPCLLHSMTNSYATYKPILLKFGISFTSLRLAKSCENHIFGKIKHPNVYVLHFMSVEYIEEKRKINLMKRISLEALLIRFFFCSKGTRVYI